MKSKHFILLFSTIVLVCTSILFSDNFHFFTIKGFVTQQFTITIGRDNNIIFKDLDTNQVQVNFKNDSAIFNLNKPTYIKINDVNVNRHELVEGSTIQVGEKTTLAYNAIEKKLKNFKNKWGYEYYPLSIILANGDNHKSIFYWKEKLEIILLDDDVKLINTNNTISTLSQYKSPIKISEGIKIQFYQPNIKHIVEDNEVRTYVDVKAIRTEWNSSHILIKSELRNDENYYKVLFSSPLSLGLGTKTISEIEKTNKIKGVFISQNEPIPDSRTYYFDTFSDIFKGILFEAQIKDTVSNDVEFSYFDGTSNAIKSIFPKLFNISSLNIGDPTGKTTLKLDYQYVNRLFLFIPFLGLWLVLFLVFGKFYHSIKNVSLKEFGGETSHNDGKYLNNYTNLITVLSILLNFKLFIAIKLCFTYPYISHLFPIALFLAYTTPFIVSYVWLKYVKKDSKKEKSLPLYSFILIVPFVILVYFFYIFYFHFFYAYNVKNVFELFTNDIIEEKLFQCIGFSIFSILIANKYSERLERVFLNIINKFVPKIKLIIKPINKIVPFSIIILCIIPAFWGKITPIILLSIFWILGNKTMIIEFVNTKLSKGKFKFSTFHYLILLLPLVCINGIFDAGSMTVFLVPFLLFIYIYFGEYLHERMLIVRQKPFIKLIILGVLALFLSFLSMKFVNNSFSPTSNDKRYEARLNIFFNQDKVVDAGYSNYEQYMEFITIMNNNINYNFLAIKPQLVKSDEQLQPTFSKGLYPVIINDLNPIIWLSVSKIWGIVLIIICFYILGDVRKIFIDRTDGKKGITPGGMIRLVAWLMLIGNGLWLLLSEFGFLPFTGRLINGFGVDSISEYIETILLFSTMGYLQPKLTDK